MTINIGSIGEEGIIRLIQEVAEICEAKCSPMLGMDDVAATSNEELQRKGQLIWTTDSMQEGAHFRFWPLIDSASLKWLGQKLALTNLSDLAAKGATPRYALLNIGLEKRTNLIRLREFLEGLLVVLARHNVVLLGGDTYSSPTWNLALTVVGELPFGVQVPMRNLAKPGDSLYVSGSLGASNHGLSLLEASTKPGWVMPESKGIPPTVDAHLVPPDRGTLGQALTRVSRRLAMMDCSDGLIVDAEKLAKASGCGVQIELNAVPYDVRLTQSGLDVYCAKRTALVGGEDYELLFASPMKESELKAALRAEGVETVVTKVGVFTETQELTVLDESNHLLELSSFTPYKHF